MVAIGSWRTCLSTISKRDTTKYPWLAAQCMVQPCSRPPDKRLTKDEEGGLSTIRDTLAIASQCSPRVHILDIGPRCDNVKAGGTKGGTATGTSLSPGLCCDIWHLHILLPLWSYSPRHGKDTKSQRQRHTVTKDCNSNMQLDNS